MTRRRWTSDDDAEIRRRFPHEPTAGLAAALGRTVGATYQRAYDLGLHKTPDYLASPAAKRTTGLQGRGTRFQKGNVPANKGLRRPGWHRGRMRDTQFKPGTRVGAANRNWRPIGTIATDADGYQRIKVREAQPGERSGFGNAAVWPQLHRHLWASVHGPIPPGHAVVFRDGNKAHCTVENLELVSQRDLMRRNSIHNLPRPLASAISMLGALKRQIRRRDAEHR